MRIAYRHPFRKQVVQYELEKLPHKWLDKGKQYYILGACEVPAKDVKRVDKTTLRKLKRIEKQIAKRFQQITQVLEENFSKFEDVE